MQPQEVSIALIAVKSCNKMEITEFDVDRDGVSGGYVAALQAAIIFLYFTQGVALGCCTLSPTGFELPF